jgi:Major Facilitator Superfamily
MTLDRLPRHQLVFATIGVMLALLLASLDQTIVGTAMPRIVAELNGLDYYAWVTTAYLVTSTVVVPIAGKLGDLFGRKLFLLAGMIGFVAASALCGLSQNMFQLVLFRGVQGLFGGVLFASVFAVLLAVKTFLRHQIGLWTPAQAPLLHVMGNEDEEEVAVRVPRPLTQGSMECGRMLSIRLFSRPGKMLPSLRCRPPGPPRLWWPLDSASSEADRHQLLFSSCSALASASTSSSRRNLLAPWLRPICFSSQRLFVRRPSSP